MPIDTHDIRHQICDAVAARRPLCIRGSGTKDFLGAASRGERLETSALSGIINYEPTELVVTAGAGTPLAELEQALAGCGQFLAFEPPRYDDRATLGGAVASGLAGPRRAYCGTVRDYILGVRMIDGRGDELQFGGQVIKNVAGFDVSRLMAGSMGTLGLLTEITLKTLPRPRAECTLRFSMDQASALESLNRWAAQPLPLSASAWMSGQLYLRLSGAEAAVRAARVFLGGDLLREPVQIWTELREQCAEFFRSANELWRVATPSTACADVLDGLPLIEWGGSLRWLQGPLDEDRLRARLRQVGGHATLYRTAPGSARTRGDWTMAPALTAIHRRLKAVFDPHGILNPGPMSATH